MNYTEHTYQAADGLSLYYRQYGTGKRVVLCVHGLTRNSKDFHDLATRLAERYRVIAVDLRGRGVSDHDPKQRRYNPGQYVKDTWNLLDQLQLKQVTLIGTSLGGLMAMIMADQQPERLRGVVLNDIGPELPLPAVQRIMRYAGLTPPAQNWQDAARHAKAAYEIALPDMPMEFWQEYVKLSYREDASGKPVPDMDPGIGEALRKPSALVRGIQWMNKHGWIKRVAGVYIDPWDSFRAITMPCLLIHGEISDVLTTEIIDKMLLVHPSMQVATVTNRGHAPLLNEPEALQAIERFLADVYS